MKTFSDLIRYVREYDGTKYSLSTNGQLNENFKSKKDYSIVYDDTSSANGDIIVTFKMTSKSPLHYIWFHTLSFAKETIFQLIER